MPLSVKTIKTEHIIGEFERSRLRLWLGRRTHSNHCMALISLRSVLATVVAANLSGIERSRPHDTAILLEVGDKARR
jgi:hypothetical protein